MPRHRKTYYRHNRLSQLRGFCHAAQTGSISKAAERLGLSQPSVSLQIQALEKEMGVALFERRGPRIQLTPEGNDLFALALPLLDGLEALPETFAARRGDVDRGELDIAAGESTLLYLLPEYVARFAADYPQIRFRLHNVTGRDGLAMLRNDAADFAVGSFLDVPDDVIYRPVFAFDPMLITAKTHPLAQQRGIALEQIAEHGLILPPQRLSTWRAVRMVFQQHELDFKVRLEAGGWEVVKKYVELGLGISIVTGICLTEADRRRLHVASLVRWFPRRSYGIVMRRGKHLTPQARRFIELMDPRFFAARRGDA
jgi:DNA-binding transcriptional LysR family regulator